MAAEQSKSVPLTCHGHSRPITHLSFSALIKEDQYYLITSCKDNNPMLRDGITGDWIGTFIGHKGAVWQARLSTDANLAATASADFSAMVWDTHTGEALLTLQHQHIVRAVAFPPGPTPNLLATGGFERKLRLFDISRTSRAPSPATVSSSIPATAVRQQLDSEPVTCYELGADEHQGPIKSIVWTPDDPHVFVSASDDKQLRWWDVRVAKSIASFGVSGAIGSCEFSTGASSADGMLSVAAGKSVYFFESKQLAKPTITHTLEQDVASVALNLRQRSFVVGGPSETWVRVYGLDSGELSEIGKGHHGPVWSVAYSPDGLLYATGSEDGTVKLWKNTAGAYGLWR